jgi:hypothetical protein
MLQFQQRRQCSAIVGLGFGNLLSAGLAFANVTQPPCNLILGCSCHLDLTGELSLRPSFIYLCLSGVTSMLLVGILLPQERRKPFHIIISHPVILAHSGVLRCRRPSVRKRSA